MIRAFTESAECARMAASGRPDPLRIPGRRPGWLGGVNLTPYRQRRARLARRRCVFEWLAAAAAGGVAVLAVIGWQAFERTRIDARRAAVERTLAQLAAPLAEHAALLRDQDERRKGAAQAVALSAPLQHLRDLLDALSFEPGDGVVLQQLRHREHETALLATSAGSVGSAGSAASEWLARLVAIRGVKGSEVSDLHRANATPAANASASAAHAADAAGLRSAPSGSGPIEFGARLLWTDPPQKTARRPSDTQPSRGAQ